jgi:hypothetical protein
MTLDNIAQLILTHGWLAGVSVALSWFVQQYKRPQVQSLLPLPARWDAQPKWARRVLVLAVSALGGIVSGGAVGLDALGILGAAGAVGAGTLAVKHAATSGRQGPAIGRDVSLRVPVPRPMSDER